MLRYQSFWLSLWIVLGPSIALARQEPQALLKRPWFEARTGHFQVYSCGPTQEVARLVARLEQFREAYSLLAGVQAVASPPIIVIAFPDHESMQPFLPFYQGKPANLTAFFRHASDENLIVMPLDSNASMEIIFHEYTHLLLRHNEHIWPLWLKEGMAELYSSFELIGTQHARLGGPLKRHLRILHNRPLLPLASLFAVGHESPDYNERERQGIFYAESWLLTQYLVFVDKTSHQARLGQITALLRQGQTCEQAFTNVLQTTLPVIENGLRHYLERDKFEPIELTLRTDITAPRNIAFRTVGTAEVCFHLGDELMRTGHAEHAKAMFERARKLAPRSPFGDEGLGMLEAAAGNPPKAVGYLQEALQLGSRSYLAHYFCAEEKLQLTSETPNRYSHIPKDKAAEIRTELERSLALMPDFGPAHHLLGFLELMQGDDLASALQHIQRAVQLEPENENYVLSLGQVQWRLDDIAAARRTLEELRRPYVEAPIRAHAAELLREIERPKAR
jgi:tetratricopeptide (TPR) repeat protein